MNTRSFFLLFIFSFSFFINLSAQTVPKESNDEKEKAQKELALKMVDEAVGDAALLKLPHNRAFVLALAGDLCWSFDEKRARVLFRAMADEIVNANAETEKIKKEAGKNYSPNYESLSRLRYDILPLVGAHDANLALELLFQTRPAEVAAAFLKVKTQSFKPNTAVREDVKPDYETERMTRDETNLEQRLTLLAAEQNPDQMIKLIKESLAKGVSIHILGLLHDLPIYQSNAVARQSRSRKNESAN